MSAVANTITAVNVFETAVGAGTDKIARTYSGSTDVETGMVRMNMTTWDTASIDPAATVKINFTNTFANDALASGDEFYIDLFTFTNDTGSTDRLNNAVYRMLAKESGDNTGVFTGTVEFVMLNQLNSDTVTAFANAVTFDRNIKIIGKCENVNKEIVTTT